MPTPTTKLTQGLLARLNRTISKLEAEIRAAKARHEETHTNYRKLLAQKAEAHARELEAKNAQHGKELEEAYQQREQLKEHNMVLQSDRDRLTATVEILSRRLASPMADQDPSRRGWRSANRELNRVSA